MSIWNDNRPRICVQVSPYITWQGPDDEMPAHIRRIHEENTA